MSNLMNGGNAAKSFIKKIVDYIPIVCFPNVKASSLKIISIVGFSLGIATMLFSFIPCLGAYAFYMAIPTLYINLLAIRREPETTNVFEVLGLIFCLVGLLIGIYWCCVLGAAANELDKAAAEFDKAVNDI